MMVSAYPVIGLKSGCSAWVQMENPMEGMP